MALRETGFARATEGIRAAGRKPAQEFGRYSDALGKPTRMEAAYAVTAIALSRAVELGKDAVGSVLWYGIGVSVMALEKAAKMKKGF